LPLQLWLDDGARQMRARGAVVGSAAADALRVIALRRARSGCRRCEPLLCAARKDLLDALVDPLLGAM
jgi:hypothetical protein